MLTTDMIRRVTDETLTYWKLEVTQPYFIRVGKRQGNRA